LCPLAAGCRVPHTKVRLICTPWRPADSLLSPA
jgi:hypothetical protein